MGLHLQSLEVFITDEDLLQVEMSNLVNTYMLLMLYKELITIHITNINNSKYSLILQVYLYAIFICSYILSSYIGGGLYDNRYHLQWPGQEGGH